MAEQILTSILSAKPGEDPDFSEFMQKNWDDKVKICHQLAKTLGFAQMKILYEKFKFPFYFDCLCDMNDDWDPEQINFFMSLDPPRKMSITYCCLDKYNVKLLSQLDGALPEVFVCYCRSGKWGDAKYCLKNGVDINYVDEAYGSTALMHAAQKGHVDIVKKLLKHGADASIQNTCSNKKAIDYCEGHGQNFDEIRNILKKMPLEEVKREPSEGEKKALDDFWRRLFSEKIETSVIKHYRKIGVPLIFSEKIVMGICEYGNLELLQEAHEEKIELDFVYPTYVGFNTPLKMAAREGHLRTVKFLIEKCKILSFINETLSIAVDQNHPNIVEYLLSFKEIDINFVDDRKMTALHQSLYHRDTIILQMLLKQDGINLEIMNNYGETPLMFAVGNNLVEHVQLLVDAGADLNAKNNLGRKAIDMCISESVVKILRGKQEESKPKTTPGAVKLTDKVHMFEENGDKYILFEETGRVVLLPVSK